ncbi:hypothetical protein HPB47_017783 [Ixodes persulcatus]|uniref:Uncharacterized protein n=1 Tax=Ixodes persulcatus TaxID=34615 RepID=A0AC60QML9_IXOPE|nr:hypothetical protein HPB47_017783 [Ixodes persulcatus]
MGNHFRFYGCSLEYTGHRTRVLKILRAEWQRQVRIYRSLLCTVLQDPSKPLSDNGRRREFLIIVNRTTEFLWQLSLQRLRSSVPKKCPAATGDVKTVMEYRRRRGACEDDGQWWMAERRSTSPPPATSPRTGEIFDELRFGCFL